MRADLHTHSTFSDGSLPIDRLPAMAAHAGLSHLAVTDHDTFAAADWARRTQSACGVRLIPGLELSAWDPANGRKVHLLCYAPQKTPALEQHCADSAAARNLRQGISMERLLGLYPFLKREDFLDQTADSGVLYRTHLMRVLRDYGLTEKLFGQLYRRLLAPGGSCYAPITYQPSVYRLLEDAHAAGALVILAHPGVYDSMDLAARLAAMGAIDGIEVDHPGNSPAQRQTLCTLAARYGLLTTGGSDYHAACGDRVAPPGSHGVAGEALQAFLDKLPVWQGGDAQ